MVNHDEVTDFGRERSYPSTYTTFLGTTLYITTLGLQFWVKGWKGDDNFYSWNVQDENLLFAADGFLQCFHSSDLQHVFYQSCCGQVCFHLLVIS
jgi:hypothetical protein